VNDRNLSLKKGDLVVWGDRTNSVNDVGIVMEVRNWGFIRSEESYVKFPLSNSEGWFLSSSLRPYTKLQEN
jgi:hypothetical protein